ncbi:MAG: hypothetical protein ACLQVD_18810 [Capsulimonadaceae bacterium]
MGLVSVPAKLTPEDIFAAIEQLEPTDADKVSRRLLTLQALRRAPHLAEREAELLRIAYREKRPGFRDRFAELNAKRRDFALTRDEQKELLDLSDESEAFDAERLDALGELARLRKSTLPKLMKDLGLKAPSVVCVFR